MLELAVEPEDTRKCEDFVTSATVVFNLSLLYLTPDVQEALRFLPRAEVPSDHCGSPGFVAKAMGAKYLDWIAAVV